MQTFKHSRAILFCKDDCMPCTLTRDRLAEILTDHPGYGAHITKLRKETHPSLVGAYDIDKFPTLVVVDSLGEEQGKLIGGSAIRDQLKGILFALYASAK